MEKLIPVGLPSLSNWTDIDFAAYELGISLGVIKKEQTFHIDVKWVFWSNNSTGNMLYKMLDQLVSIGYLEKREEPDFQYRLNPNWQLK